jgi:hypothetical protein
MYGPFARLVNVEIAVDFLVAVKHVFEIIDVIADLSCSSSPSPFGLVHFLFIRTLEA